MRWKHHCLAAAASLTITLIAVIGSLWPEANAAVGPPAGAVHAVTHSEGAQDDLSCRLCHQDTDAVINLPSGEELPALVDLTILDHSAHGSGDEALRCTECHDGNLYRQPHEGLDAADYRQFQIQNSASCVRCHDESHLTSHENISTEQSVVCTDCHGGHDVAPVAEWSDEALTGRCLTCHEPDDGARLLAITSAGLFGKKADEAYCLACHQEPGPTVAFASGESISVHFDDAVFRNSVHGDGNDWGEISCRNCHETTTYPHPPVTAESSREYALTASESCAACHDHNSDMAQDSVHAVALAEGEIEAAVCTDCHGSHDVLPANEPRSQTSAMCRECHSTIYDEYASSIHGEALIDDDNPDVPACIDCHGVHDIQDPTTNVFRNSSPELCGNCHANESLMAEYEISTNVFDSYVADFHGTTVTLFEHQDPELETNKAVCYDCHGIHDISSPDDPDAGIKTNLLDTCQQCHPGATSDFPDAWTSHFEPSLDNNPIVYLIEKFYEIITPLTFGGLGFLVATDLFRRIRLRGRKSSGADNEIS